MSGFTEIRTKHVQRAKYYGTFVIGFVLGIWTIPNQALNVPNSNGQTHGHTEASTGIVEVAYYPVNEYLFIFLLIPVIYIAYYYFQDRNFEAAYSEHEKESL